MPMDLPHVNYLAVLVAALATFFLGGLWYSPLLFAKAWVKAHGYSPERVQQMQKGAGKAYAGSVLAYLVMAFVLAILVAYCGAASWQQGAWIGFLCWLGFAATIGLTANLFSEKSFAVYWIDAGYQLVYLVLMGAILGAWR